MGRPRVVRGRLMICIRRPNGMVLLVPVDSHMDAVQARWVTYWRINLTRQGGNAR